MTSIISGDEISVLGGKSLNLELQNLRNDVDALFGPERMLFFSKVEQLQSQININTMTLKQLALAIPLYSTLVLGVDNNGQYASTLPLPYITQSSTPVYMRGTLTIEATGGDYRRVNFTFRNRDLVAVCSYLEYEGASVSPWVIQQCPMINRNFQAASYWGGLISNIWMPGTYYFTTVESANFTDLPPGFSGPFYLDVKNKDITPAGERIYTLTANSSTVGTWIRQKSGAWQHFTFG